MALSISEALGEAVAARIKSGSDENAAATKAYLATFIKAEDEKVVALQQGSIDWLLAKIELLEKAAKPNTVVLASLYKMLDNYAEKIGK